MTDFEFATKLNSNFKLLLEFSKQFINAEKENLQENKNFQTFSAKVEKVESFYEDALKEKLAK